MPGSPASRRRPGALASCNHCHWRYECRFSDRCPNVKHYDTFNKVYRTYFKTELPPRAFIGAGTLLFDARFEMQGIAVKRQP